LGIFRRVEAEDFIGGAAGDDEGVASNAFRAAIDHVPAAGAAFRGSPVNRVIAGAAIDDIVASAAIKTVIAGHAGVDVVAAKAANIVAAGSAVDDVVTGIAGHGGVADQDEVGSIDHIRSGAVDPSQDDGAAGDVDMGAAANDGDADRCIEIGVGDAEAAQVDLVLSAPRWVGIEAGHRVGAEIGLVVNDGVEPAAHIDGVIASAAMQRIIAVAAGQRVVAVAAIERIVASVADEPVSTDTAI